MTESAEIVRLQRDVERLQRENRRLRARELIRARLRVHSVRRGYEEAVVAVAVEEVSDDGPGAVHMVDSILRRLSVTHVDMFGCETEALQPGWQKPEPKRKASEYQSLNPWRKETFNITKQGRLVRENPDLAARLRAEAEAEA